MGQILGHTTTLGLGLEPTDTRPFLYRFIPSALLQLQDTVSPQTSTHLCGDADSKRSKDTPARAEPPPLLAKVL